MLELDKIDFKKMGFQGGLEVHHQLDTNRKLFCNCASKLSNGKPDYLFERYFRPVLGEMGDFDAGMLIEFEKGYRVIYHAFEETVCCYEQDEQPPFWPDFDAIYKGYELAHWLNFSALVDEIVVSRKQYLDGSITTGFQRTMIVARDGFIPMNGKKYRISNLTVEEDAARKIKTENFGRTVYYNLDRLGTPLVEVITDHRDCDNPYDLQRLAEYIGLTLRLSSLGKRGIGTVRQDVNISITGGDRVEIKGVQDLNTFVDVARREVARQHTLLEIRDMLNARKVKKADLEHTYVDLTEHFDSGSIPGDYIIMGVKLPFFDSLLKLEIQPNKDFGQDIIEKTELISGIPRFYQFNSDEMDAKSFRRINQKKKLEKGNDVQKNYFFKVMTIPLHKNIKKALGVKKNDAYFVAMGPQKWAIHAMKKIIERAKMALDGVPQETRRFLPDNNTEFLRVIHGKDRLYPDTDTPPIDLDLKKISKLKSKVKLRPWEIVEEFSKKYNLNYDQVVKLIRHERIELFSELVEKDKLNPIRCFVFLEETLVAIRREGFDGSKLKKEHIKTILEHAEKGVYDINLIPKVAQAFIEKPKKNIKQILSDLKIRKISENDLERIFNEAKSEILSNKEYSKLDSKALGNKITGCIMKKINGGYPGKKLSNFVLSRLKGEGKK